MVCATAADLFPELVFRILSSIGHDPDPARHFYPVPMNKQHLGICSLVCRFWAQWCRPHIFYSITLRSAEDFEQLVQLMDTPSKVLPSIRQCLVKLIVIRRGACDAPYLHLIARHWEHLVDFEMLPVNSSSPLSSDSIADYAPHSMSVGLPRTLPGSMYPLYSITLSDLRFRNTGDVLKLIRNLYDLTKLECTKLRFDNVSPVLPGGTRRVRGQLLSVSISDCGSSDSNCQIELLASIVSSSFTGTNLFMSPRRLSVEAWGTICRLLTALAPSSYTHIRRDSSSGKRLALAFLQGTKDRLLGITIDTAAGQTGAGSVKSLSIWLSRTLKASDLAQIDWNAVEDAFIQLVHTDASLEIITNSDDVFK